MSSQLGWCSSTEKLRGYTRIKLYTSYCGAYIILYPNVMELTSAYTHEIILNHDSSIQSAAASSSLTVTLLPRLVGGRAKALLWHPLCHPVTGHLDPVMDNHDISHFSTVFWPKKWIPQTRLSTVFPWPGCF